MQSYRDEPRVVPSSNAMNALDVGPATSTRTDEMGKYRARYEESMNPFEVFRGRVRLSYQLLHSVLTTFFLGSSTSRPGSQPRRTGYTCAHASHIGQSTVTECFHLVRRRFAPTCPLYTIRVYHGIRDDIAEATAASIWISGERDTGYSCGVQDVYCRNAGCDGL